MAQGIPDACATVEKKASLSRLAPALLLQLPRSELVRLVLLLGSAESRPQGKSPCGRSFLRRVHTISLFPEKMPAILISEQILPAKKQLPCN